MIELNKSENGIATVTLNRPEKHNAFDEQLIEQMTQAFKAVDKDNSIKVMILAAKGDNFSAGADLAWMKRMASYSYEDNLEDSRALADMLSGLNSISKPTIARVQGSVFGGAVGLVSCCDMAIATDTSRFCLSEVKIGLTPATISPYVLAAMGQRAARRYFLSAEQFSAQEAKHTGLVSEISTLEELDQTVNKLCSKLLSNSPQAMSGCKELISDFSNKAIDHTIVEDSCQRIASIRTSEQGQEGLSAFLEKRKPNWSIKSNGSNSKESK